MENFLEKFRTKLLSVNMVKVRTNYFSFKSIAYHLEEYNLFLTAKFLTNYIQIEFEANVHKYIHMFNDSKYDTNAIDAT